MRKRKSNKVNDTRFIVVRSITRPTSTPQRHPLSIALIPQSDSPLAPTARRRSLYKTLFSPLPGAAENRRPFTQSTVLAENRRPFTLS
ncbi:hypothetical protein KFK09_023397 [Dendrobium nobile]|uniref:Uncharacterized protein n=1 Tax=Dendrobium nobile TaxID=94219 RepID=A0A8T3AKZ0_DENNO|nr:hypothetical protein KFK09_023397 [Dendrobium nobile]